MRRIPSSALVVIYFFYIIKLCLSVSVNSKTSDMQKFYTIGRNKTCVSKRFHSTLWSNKCADWLHLKIGFEIAPITRHQCRSRSDLWPRYISSGTPWIFLPQKWRALPGRTARQTAPSLKSHAHCKREKHFYNFTLFIFRIFFLWFHTDKPFMNMFDDCRQLRQIVGGFHSLR